jgi:hypothetical protein
MKFHLITTGDYLLLPLYLILFYSIARYYRNKYLIAQPDMAKIFIWAFNFKIISALAFAFVTEFYFKNGDTYIYFEEGSKLFNWILKKGSNASYIFSSARDFEELKSLYADPDNPGFASSESNFMPIRFIAFLSLLSFNKYLVISIFFSLFSFFGLWKLYQSFTFFYPALKKQLALPFFFMPSVLFWGSSVLKDPICIGCIGWIISGFVNIFFKGKSRSKNLPVIFIACFILYLTKGYIMLALAVSIIFWLVAALKERIPYKTLRNLTFPFLLLITVLSIFLLLDNIQEALGQYALDSFAENVMYNQMNYAASEDAAGGSYFAIGDIDATPVGMLKLAPKVINATFFRPYIWESKNIMMLFSAIESMALMLFTVYVLYKLRFIRFFTAILNQPLLLQCFVFSIIFGFAVGITTPNFGTLMRYKIPCIPFFVSMLIIIKYAGMLNKSIQDHSVDSGGA